MQRKEKKKTRDREAKKNAAHTPNPAMDNKQPYATQTTVAAAAAAELCFALA